MIMRKGSMTLYYPLWIISYTTCQYCLLFLRLVELGENLNNKVNQVVRCKRLKINETLYSISQKYILSGKRLYSGIIFDLLWRKLISGNATH